MNTVSFEFIKDRHTEDKIPFEQSAIAAEVEPEENEIPDENKFLPRELESAKDKSGFKPGIYKPLDKPGVKVPGLW